MKYPEAFYQKKMPDRLLKNNKRKKKNCTSSWLYNRTEDEVEKKKKQGVEMKGKGRNHWK